MLLRVAMIMFAMFALPVLALEEVYLAPDKFVEEVVGEAGRKPEVLWLTKDRVTRASAILGHAPAQLRQRFWRSEGKTVWVLEAIGKDEPITVGFVVERGRVKLAKVLVYRESRGGEIRYPGFLKQYEGVGLTQDDRLDRSIDGISGATLSVRAMERMARLALYFDQLSVSP